MSPALTIFQWCTCHHIPVTQLETHQRLGPTWCIRLAETPTEFTTVIQAAATCDNIGTGDKVPARTEVQAFRLVGEVGGARVLAVPGTTGLPDQLRILQCAFPGEMQNRTLVDTVAHKLRLPCAHREVIEKIKIQRHIDEVCLGEQTLIRDTDSRVLCRPFGIQVAKAEVRMLMPGLTIEDVAVVDLAVQIGAVTITVEQAAKVHKFDFRTTINSQRTETAIIVIRQFHIVDTDTHAINLSRQRYADLAAVTADIEARGDARRAEHSASFINTTDGNILQAQAAFKRGARGDC